MSVSSSSYGHNTGSFVSADFEVPEVLETELEAVVRAWLAEEWPFQNVVFPGKELSLDEWNKQEQNT